jgi:hypothetical protein
MSVKRKETLANQEKMKELLSLNNEALVEEFISNNELRFELNKIEYKVTKPTFKQRQLLSNERIKKYSQLLSAKDELNNYIYKTEKDLTKEYKERGIDIDAMVTRFNALDMKKKDYQIKLGKLLSEKKPEAELNLLKNEIISIEKEQSQLIQEKTALLEPCLETQLLVYLYSYLAFLITDKKEGDNWVKAFKTFEEFENTDLNLIDNIVYRATLLTGSNL